MQKLLAVIIFIIWSQLVAAQEKTVRVVIPQASSSGLSHVYSHLEKFASKKNISMIPIYKPGANGAIGINYAINEKKDDILLLSVITDYVTVSAEKNFKPIGAINEIELTLIASKKSNIKTVSDIVTVEKSNPGKLNWAQYSSAAGEFITKFSKIHGLDPEKVHRIQYKDPKVSDIVNGDVDLAFMLTRLAKSLSDNQHVTLVEVDNFTKSKLAEKKNATALFAPAVSNSATIKFWNDFLNEFLADSDVKEFFRKANSRTFDNSNPEHLEEIISNWKTK